MPILALLTLSQAVAAIAVAMISQLFLFFPHLLVCARHQAEVLENQVGLSYNLNEIAGTPHARGFAIAIDGFDHKGYIGMAERIFNLGNKEIAQALFINSIVKDVI